MRLVLDVRAEVDASVLRFRCGAADAETGGAMRCDAQRYEANRCETDDSGWLGAVCVRDAMRCGGGMRARRQNGVESIRSARQFVSSRVCRLFGNNNINTREQPTTASADWHGIEAGRPVWSDAPHS